MIADLWLLGTVVLAGALGAIVGAERELSGKPAGLRTHLFVSAGAALLILLSDSAVQKFVEQNQQHVSADPIRVIQAIVVGISFLGAGTIIHERGQRVEGLTTAASIFITAGIGIAVATDHVVLATGTALGAVLVLWLMGRLERRIAE
ncbi:MgtC/SapB family protein [Aureliella helgolandensis]|uniref:Putative Mg(2+) transport ATPase n=1 Tax=Aureliella helgolandensis TaxID=2527968 RepID=A0A518G3H2_9BACT|nr:MgtC/SapB family protein [Aureliella helgolandensis]QDV23143.1 putative Mg(2+) transport ATPase [Aureliella helgolandensis]